MRKRIVLLCSVLVTALLIGACSRQPDVDMKTLMAQVKEKFSLVNMTEVSSPEELKSLFQIDLSETDDCAVAYSAQSDERVELILIKAKDKDASENIQTTLFNRLDAFLSGAKSYSPDAYSVLEKCHVAVYNDIYVTLIISKQSQEIDQYIKETIG